MEETDTSRHGRRSTQDGGTMATAPGGTLGVDLEPLLDVIGMSAMRAYWAKRGQSANGDVANRTRQRG